MADALRYFADKQDITLDGESVFSYVRHSLVSKGSK